MYNTLILKEKQSFFYFICCLIFTAVACTQCGHGVVVQDSELTQFHNLSHNIEATNLKEGVDMYIDFSDGIHPAILNANNVFDETMNILSGEPNTQYYVCGAESSFKALSKEELLGTYNPKLVQSFKETVSVLDKPIANIIQTGREAIFVTDFEMVRSMTPTVQRIANGTVSTYIDLSPDWATPFFKEWLSMGNSIDVFAKKFTKTKKNGVQSQFLYFLVFTPKDKAKSMVCEGLNKMVGKETDFYHLDFSKSRYELIPDHASPQYGLNELIGTNAYVKGKNFEYYQFNVKDFSILDNASDKALIQKLVFKNNMSLFPNISIKCEVSDITENYQHFFDSLQLGATPAGLKKMPLKGEAVTDKFTVKLEPSGEIKLMVDPSYRSIDHAKYSQMFQVNVLIDKANLTFNEQQIAAITRWRDSGGFDIEALYKALQAASEKTATTLPETCIYTYYIEMKK